LARKILLADDSVTAQNMGRKILADAGYEVLTVNNGSAALKRINEIKPDLIVLDVYMPGYSGLEVCQRLKESEETRHIPVLLTVGKLEPFKPDEARRVKADAHIVKPFEASELLSAIATLEDRLVAHANRAKFVTSEGEISTESGEFDSGWKNRLRFPSKKKKKEEPEPDPEELGNFREFRKGKKKATATASSSTPPAAEPAAVPDIPRDITPDELDALSALAAKLDGPSQEAEKIAALIEKANVPAEVAATVVPATLTATSEASASEEEKAASAPDAPTAVATAAIVPQETPVAETKAETKAAEATAPATEITAAQPTKEFEVPAPPTVVEAATVASAIEIPLQHTEAPSESPAAAKQVEWSKAPEAAPLVNTASLAESPAPVDQQDEPMFASAKAEALTTKSFEVVASSEAKAPAPEAATKTEEPGSDATTPVVVKTEETNIEDPPAAEVEVAVVAETAAPVVAAPSNVEPEAPAPSDEELAEALRLLTPSPVQGEITIPSQGTLVAAGQLLAEEAARHAAANSRWTALTVALTPEEVAISLEEEMFRAFAATPAAQITTVETTSVTESTSVQQTAVAVEDKPVVATSTVVGESAAPSVAEIAPAIVEDASAQSAEELKQEPAATFANLATEETRAAEDTAAPQVQSEEVSTAPTVVESAVATQAIGTAETAETQESTSETGGQDDMAKDSTGKSSKSQWREIHPATNAVPRVDATEAAKQAEEAAPKAMAAAAAAESAPSQAGTSDANSIANIVDSVLADLRPKIVEEIAKKLAGK
jgi:CheY-like chemotaxis protein